MNPWQATLTLRFAAREGKTILTHNAHSGPLRVQKALYPEASAPSICHAIIVHPPAGIADGDQLSLDIALQANAHAVLSTPGATQWYKSSAQTPAHMTVKLHLAPHAKLDWLPQENIFFDASHAQLTTTLDLDPSASAIGWDITVFGRTATGETWQQAALHQHSRISRGGAPLWIEHSELHSASSLRTSAAALADHPIIATLWAVGPHATSELAQAIAPDLPYTQPLKAGITCLNDENAGKNTDQHAPGGALLLRVLGQDMQIVRALLINTWHRLRPIIHQTPATPLRLWAL